MSPATACKCLTDKTYIWKTMQQRIQWCQVRQRHITCAMRCTQWINMTKLHLPSWKLREPVRTFYTPKPPSLPYSVGSRFVNMSIWLFVVVALYKKKQCLHTACAICKLRIKSHGGNALTNPYISPFWLPWRSIGRETSLQASFYRLHLRMVEMKSQRAALPDLYI